ncbi:MAG TPA: SLC13 family permease [Candidatus Salinicoccus stercoripullorum]|uniref:Sodium-dependent dicarboxylate transporter SdcS n=1 Tax=Candidatus Salinicoccus stercoripullorum TaxID=2838756 RepID=A0A9D1QGM6_9STAP|nr:SLC13 family permease [Candidatus Salinicoccus stercoripullorum]
MSDSKVKESYDNLWRESKRTKSLLKFFSVNESKKHAEKGSYPTNDEGPEKSYNRLQLTGLILGPALFILTLLFLEAEGLDGAGVFVVASTLWIATWWITEAIPIPATSLMPLFLFPMGGVMDSGTTTSSYGNDIIFLFLGGFLIALAMERWNLHTRIALSIINAIGTTTATILLGFMIATGLLSMFVSNTAAVMIMIPIGMAIINEANALTESGMEADLKMFEKSLVLGIGYAGTIGGLGTLIGTPPLIIMAGQLKEIFDLDLSFAQWMMFGVPIVIIFLGLAWAYMNYVAFRHDMKQLPGGKRIITSELEKLGKISREEILVLIVFLFAAFMWITRGFIWENLEMTSMLTDGAIAMLAAVILFLLPTKRGSKRILDWSVARELPWGVLLLFGGGLALAAAIVETGVDQWLGELLTEVEGVHIVIVIAIVALGILFLTEITSNTATATMIIPVLAGLAIALEVHPLTLMVPAAMAANCAFMLPVGTPPNAIVFGTNKISIQEMAKTGFALNMVAVVLIVAFVYLLMPVLFGIDLMNFNG